MQYVLINNIHTNTTQ